MLPSVSSSIRLFCLTVYLILRLKPNVAYLCLYFIIGRLCPMKCEIWKVFGSRHNGLWMSWGRLQRTWESEYHERVWQEETKCAHFFEDCFKFLITNFPSHPIAFFSKLKTRAIPFIWYYLFWWRHKYFGLHCVQLPEIWYCLPEETGRTSEDINWQQNNP